MRGKSGYVPFWPGGLENTSSGSSLNKSQVDPNFKRIPPGFSRGLRLPGDDPDDEEPPHGEVQQKEEPTEEMVPVFNIIRARHIQKRMFGRTTMPIFLKNLM